MTHDADLKRAQHLSNIGDWDKAYAITDHYLSESPNDVDWLMLMTFIMMGTGKRALAYSLAKRCVELSPKDASMYLNAGMAANDLWMPTEAERLYRKGMRLAKKPEQLSKFLVNLTGVYIDNGRYAEAEKICHQIIEINPDTVKGYANLGFCQVAQKQWDAGWPNYRKCIGTEWRPKMVYGDEPEWDGVSRGTIVLYAEQGLGDMICFASMLPDMQRWCDDNESTLVLDLDSRLYNLFNRSFPGIAMYPTAGVKAENMRPEMRWADEHCKIDYSLPMGQVAEYFRTKAEDFPRTPYLEPDQDETFKWRSLFESKGRPAIGIAWTGGHPKTGAHLKRLTLEQLVPLFRSIDATWVSLQYRHCTPEIAAFRAEHPDIDLVEYPKTTLDKDYDQTASLVAALDAVVSVPTTVVHLGGALGVRTIAMEAPMRCWKFEAGNPFHPITAQIPHSDDWDATIRETASYLEDLCITSSSATTQDSPSLTTSRNTA